MRKFFITVLFVATAFLSLSCSSSTSPSGGTYDKIIYSQRNTTGDSLNVYSMNPDGSGKIMIYKGGQINSAPEGNSLLIAKALPNDSTEYIMTDLNGYNKKVLFKISGINNFAVLSPDSRYVAYSFRLHNLENNSDFIIGDTLAYYSYDLPVFSPDSKQLLYSTLSTINVINTDGSGMKTITSDCVLNQTHAELLQDFDWSPDGKKVCFYSFVSGRQGKLNFFDVATSSSTNIVVDSLEKFPVKWSPKGTYLLYQVASPFSYHGNQYVAASVWQYNTITLEKKKISLPFSFSDHLITDYVWSPDEKLVLLNSNEYDPSILKSYSTIYSLDITSGKAIDLKQGGAEVGGLYWSHIVNQ